MPAWLVFLLVVLASYRLTRLIVVDDFPPIAHARDGWSERHVGHWTTYLINCPFCISVWAAGFVTLVLWLCVNFVDGPGLPLPFLWWAGAAGAVAVGYEVLARLPDV